MPKRKQRRTNRGPKHKKKKRVGVRKSNAEFYIISEYSRLEHAKIPNSPHIIGYPIFIIRDHELAKYFPHKSWVLELHIDARTLTEFKSVVRLFREKDAGLREDYLGFYGDTSNTAIIEYARKRGAILTDVSPERHREMQRRYETWAKEGVFPKNI
jgi:hypothetical protein